MHCFMPLENRGILLDCPDFRHVSARTHTHTLSLQGGKNELAAQTHSPFSQERTENHKN